MHYSPRIWQRRGPELPLLFPIAYPPLPFFFHSSPFQPAARGPEGAVAKSRWPTIGYFFTLLLTMIVVAALRPGAEVDGLFESEGVFVSNLTQQQCSQSISHGTPVLLRACW